jgi:hypothetical protein
VFSEIQDPETGDFILSGLANVDWISFAVVTAVCAIAALILHLAEKSKKD